MPVFEIAVVALLVVIALRLGSIAKLLYIIAENQVEMTKKQEGR